MSISAIIKTALYRSGALRAYHRIRNRDNLTVVMLHRVLRRDDPRFAWSNPEYTLPDDHFRLILQQLKRDYTIVALDLVQSGGSLPPCPLLITFDDGWADNADTALPIMIDEGVTATMFVATGHIGSERPFWQELVYGAWRAGRLPEGAFQGAAIPPKAGQEPTVLATIDQLGRLDAARREEIIDALWQTVRWPGRSMCTAEELRAWYAAGMSLGTHGVSHDPIDSLADPAHELADARHQLAAATGLSVDDVTAMSFPHGRYDAGVLRAAAEAGYTSIFSSDRRLIAAGAGTSPMPRVYITDRFLAGEQADISQAQLATWLFLQPA